jgi:acyl carrier protein
MSSDGRSNMSRRTLSAGLLTTALVPPAAGAQTKNPARAPSEKELSDCFLRVRKIVVEHLGVDAGKVTLRTRVNDLTKDSLDKIEFLMLLEIEFGIRIPFEVSFDELFVAVEDMVVYVHNAHRYGVSGPAC